MTPRITDLEPLEHPTIARPGYRDSVDDPTFATTTTRITDDGMGGDSIRHHYSKNQCWNADESLILLAGGYNNHPLLLDATNYSLVRTLSGIGGGGLNPVWGSQPDTILHVSGSRLMRYSVNENRSYVLRDFGSQLGPINGMEGDASDNDKTVCLTTGTQIISYNVRGDKEHGRIAKPANFNFAQPSRSGNYIVVGVNGFGLTLYSNTFADPRAIFPSSAPHCDFAYTEQGGECLVAFNMGEMGGYDLRAYDLPNGPWRVILPNYGRIGWVGGHVSGRGACGWVTISDYEKASYYIAAGFDEVFDVRLDGSGDVRRWTHQHSHHPATTVVPYVENAMATPNNTGSKILYSTRWANHWTAAPQGKVHAYVVEG